MDYKDWLAYKSNLAKRDVSQDENDYDLQGYFNSLNSSQEGSGDHLPDTYKKPNHPTFSDESKYSVPVINQGGSWSNQDNGNFKFKPSSKNIENMGKENLQSYFNEVESPESLDLPNDEKMSLARKAALQKISN